MTQRSRPRACKLPPGAVWPGALCRNPLTSSTRSFEQQIEIIEQELAPFMEGHGRGSSAGARLGRLAEDPGIAQGTAANQDASDGRIAEPLDNLIRLDAIA